MLRLTLLRLLRHDDRVAKSSRFRALNLLGVGLVCAAGFALSQPAIVSALGVAWNWFVENVVLILLTLAAWAIQWVLYGFAWIFATVFGVVLATLTLQIVQSGFTAVRLSAFEYAMAQGLILVAVMVFDQVKWRGRRKRAVAAPST